MSGLTLQVTLIAIAAALVSDSIITIGLCSTFGWKQGSRWVQNCPSVTGFMLSAYPLAVGLFAMLVVMHPPALHTSMGRAVAIGALVPMLIVAVLVVTDDFMHLDTMPFLLNRRDGQAARAFRHELELRRMAAETRYQSPRCARYAELTRPFGDLRGVRRRGNWLAWALLWQNLHAAVLVTAVAWYVALFAFNAVRDPDKPFIVSVIVMIGVLLFFWLPVRLYSNWYQFAPYRADWSARQQIFWAILIFAGIGAVVVLYLDQPAFTTKLVVGAVTSLLAVFAAAERFQWSWLQRVLRTAADGIQRARFVYALFIYAAMLIFFAVLAGSVLAPVSKPAVQQTGHPR